MHLLDLAARKEKKWERNQARRGGSRASKEQASVLDQPGEMKTPLPEPGTLQSNWDYEKHVRPRLKSAGPSRDTSHETFVRALKTEKVGCVSEQG